MSTIRTKKALLTLVSMALAALLAVTACGGSGSDEPVFPAVQRGNNISITVWGSEKRDAVYYEEDGTRYVIRPSAPGRKLAVVSATVRNDRSNTVIMTVDEDGYSLIDKEGKRHPSRNPFIDRELAPNIPQGEGLYSFIWGPFELPNGFGITAWAIFDVPEEIEPAQFRWATVETVFVRFFPFT